MTFRKLEEILSAVGERNASLINEVAKYRKEGRRVFIIAGASHFLQFPAPHKSSANVKKALQEHKFIIITRKKKFRNALARLNPDLAHQIRNFS